MSSSTPVVKTISKPKKKGLGTINTIAIVILILIGVFGFFVTYFDSKDATMFSRKNRPGILQVGSKHRGSIDGLNKDYSKAQDGSESVDMVDNYYTLSTDWYMFGWGESFHFAHRMQDESFEDSIVRHEERLIPLVKMKKGKKILDAGCGVGGPLRNIAKASGSYITGLTINQYQVDLAKDLNEQAGLSDTTDVIRGDFTKMPFKDQSFDGAYSIEASCHAPQLVDLYKEIYRVLKPGSRYADYQWISTEFYDPSNEKHAAILEQIEFGNGLPPVRSKAQVLQAAKEAGLKLISEFDLAQDDKGTRPWYERLNIGMPTYYFTHYLTYLLETIGIQEKGAVDTHSMLMTAGFGLCDGGKANIFTPMHLFVFERP